MCVCVYLGLFGQRDAVGYRRWIAKYKAMRETSEMIEEARMGRQLREARAMAERVRRVAREGERENRGRGCGVLQLHFS